MEQPSSNLLVDTRCPQESKAAVFVGENNTPGMPTTVCSGREENRHLLPMDTPNSARVWLIGFEPATTAPWQFLTKDLAANVDVRRQASMV